MRPEVSTPEQTIARIARGAHGVVTRVELLTAGISPQQIKRRVRKGGLIAVHRGVYRVGHRAPSLEALYLAAVRACGAGAALSGLAAAYLWGLLKGQAPAPEVTAPTARRVPGVATRRRACGGDVTIWRGIPVTTVQRTLVDLASVLPAAALARACHEAGIRYGTTPAQVEAVLARRPNAPGAARLRRVLHGDEHVTLSKLERRFLALLRQHGLQLPETNRRAGTRRVDCRWPEVGLTVELDGYRYHRSRHAWEQDREREREAYERGDQLRRYTYENVIGDPSRMLAELRALVPTSSSPRTPSTAPCA